MRAAWPGAWLGIHPFVFSAEQQATYLKDIGERDPLYAEQGILHDGTLLRELPLHLGGYVAMQCCGEAMWTIGGDGIVHVLGLASAGSA